MKKDDKLLKEAKDAGVSVAFEDDHKDVTEEIIHKTKESIKPSVAEDTKNHLGHLNLDDLMDNVEPLAASTDGDSDDSINDKLLADDTFTDSMPINTPSVMPVPTPVNDDAINKDITMNNISDLLIELDDTIDGTKRLKTVKPSKNFSATLNKVLKPVLADGYLVQGTLPVVPDKDRTVINLTHKTKNVTRTKIVEQEIKYYMADDSKAPDNIKRKLTFIQNGTKDLVTNQISWSTDSQSQSFSKMPSPKRRGYIPDQEFIPEQEITVNNDNFDLSLNKIWLVNYVAEVLTIKIQIIDDDEGGTILRQYKSTGYDGAILNINIDDIARDMKTQHYLISQNNLPEKLIFETGKAPVYQIHVIHERGQLHDDTSLETEGTYEIRLVDKFDNELAQPIVLTQRYARSGQKDFVTGEINYSEWRKVNTIPKYQTTPAELKNDQDEKLIPLSTKVIIPDIMTDTRQTVDQKYYAPKQIVTLNYLRAGKVVTSSALGFMLREDEVIELQQLQDRLKKIGYRILPNQSIPTSYSYDETKDDQRSYNINVEAILKPTIEHKVVKRTIIITTPTNAKRAIIESAELTRKVIIDLSKKPKEVGSKSYGEWSTNMWDEYVPPVLTGYVPSQLSVGNVLVGSDTKDTKIRIHYIPYDKQDDQQPEVDTEKPQTFIQRIKTFLLPGSNKNNKSETNDNTLKLSAPDQDEK